MFVCLFVCTAQIRKNNWLEKAGFNYFEELCYISDLSDAETNTDENTLSF